MLTIAASGFSGCMIDDPPSDSAGPPIGEFAEVFVEVGSIVLEESDSSIITDVSPSSFTVAPDGRIALGDRGQSRIQIYDDEGKFLRALGGVGAGPGEYNGVTGLTFLKNGTLYAADPGNRRLTRYHPSLELDTVFQPATDGMIVNLLTLPNDRLLLNVSRSDPPEFLELHDSDFSQRTTLFHTDPKVWQVPYWRSAGGRLVASNCCHIFVSNTLTFPLYRYSLEGLAEGTFGVPPRTWIPAPQPQVGEFAGASSISAEQWFRTFTRIGGLHVLSDSLVLVSNHLLDPSELRFRVSTYRMDVYDLEGDRLIQDLLVPGVPLHTDDVFYVLTGEPPMSPWIITKYRFKEAQ